MSDIEAGKAGLTEKDARSAQMIAPPPYHGSVGEK
jgi:hypothetical protein